jgi:hypothetical protein
VTRKRKGMQNITFRRGDDYDVEYKIGDKDIHSGDVLELSWPDGTKVKGKALIRYTYHMLHGCTSGYDKYDLRFKTKLRGADVEIVLSESGTGLIDELGARFVKRPRKKEVTVDTA